MTRLCLLGACLALCACQSAIATPGREPAGGIDAGRSEDAGEMDRCGDGFDGDGDGVVDEGCGCALGSRQHCWSGDPAHRGVGECRDGAQACSGGEFPSWGACEGTLLPSLEVPGNDLDEDCDGVAADPGRPPDCDKGDEGDEGDDEMDECIRPADPDPPPPPPPPPPSCSAEVCDDGIDNDCDGASDCSDSSCTYAAPDCGCRGCVPGTHRWCDTPVACAWGRQECLPDGSWGRCHEVDRRPTGCSGRWFDRDCCIAAGACCENFPTNRRSVGDCARQCPG